jgi:DNA-binding winged helix-turn-helix (wHTH) protein
VGLHFAGCTIDLGARRLWRGADQVHLSPKALDTLKILIERRPAAVSKAELLERVWPAVFVSEASLTRVINEIRRAVGDDARQGGTIRTVHTFGYAFVAEARADAREQYSPGRPRATCLLVSGARTVVLLEGERLVGRAPDSDVWLDSPKVSWRHARIGVSRGSATIEDLGSKNGTLVGDRRIDRPTRLRHGDEIRIGRVRFVFRTAEARQVTETDRHGIRS